MTFPLVFSLVLFLITYVLLLALPNYRPHIALTSALIFILSGIISFKEAFFAIDFNVLMMLTGTMGIVALFVESKMPSLLSDLILEKVPNVKIAIIALALFAGLISAFVDNVATVLMIAPIAITLSKRLNISPVPSILAIAISSNLQGAATLVGDATAILLGSHADMDFFDFIFYRGRPGLFWVVQLGAIAFTIVCYFLFKKYSQPLADEFRNKRTPVNDYLPSVLLLGMIVLLILSSFIPNRPALTGGIICMTLFIGGFIVTLIRKKDSKIFKITYDEIDFETLLLLAALFIIITGITKAGVVDEIGKIFVKVGGTNVFVLYSLVVWVSVLFSAFIDNIPYVAMMLPVISCISAGAGIDPTILYFGMLTGATLGGNFTPIGASANIAALGILRKEGHKVKLGEYLKISIPTTLSAVLTGYILVWLIWYK